MPSNPWVWRPEGEPGRLVHDLPYASITPKDDGGFTWCTAGYIDDVTTLDDAKREAQRHAEAVQRIFGLLGDYDGLCMDDTGDRKTMAEAIIAWRQRGKLHV